MFNKEKRFKKYVILIMFFVYILLSSVNIVVADSTDTRNITGINVYNLESTDTDVFISYSVSEPQVISLGRQYNGTDLYRVNLNGAPSEGKVGQPILPVIQAKVIIPGGRLIDEITVSRENLTSISGNYFIEFGVNPQPLTGEPIIQDDHPENTIYESNLDFPETSYELVTEQKKHGINIAFINIYPVVYRPEQRKLCYYQDIDIKIITKTDANRINTLNSSVWTVQPRPSNYVPGDLDIVNPQALSTYGEDDFSSLSLSASQAIVQPGDFRYVIVTGSEMIDSTADYTVHDLINHRKKYGLTATIVNISNILNEYAGVDNAEKLRNFIIDAYNNWGTEYVLLGGDTNIIPYRKLYAIVGTKNDHLPSDLYFQCLDGSFNSDGDSNWGEPNDGIDGGDVDLLSEIAIGRASAENASEMANWIYKTIAYETDQSTYKKNNLMVGEKADAITYTKFSLEELRLGSTAHGVSTLGFNSDSTFSSDVLYDMDATWTKSAIISKINFNQYGIINHAGHSNYNSNMRMDNEDANNLTNSNPLFLYTQGCFPGDFERDCIGERFTTSTRKGMFAVVMNSRYGWYEVGGTNKSSQHCHRQFWHAYFSKNIRELGKLNAKAHEENISLINFDNTCRWTIYNNNLLGDPCTKLAEAGSAPPSGDGQTPWSTNGSGPITPDADWDSTMGYNFTPQRDGIITNLGGYFNGTKTVYLWNAGTGELLRTVDVTSADSWSFFDISPVAVNPGTMYTVAVYSNGSGAVSQHIDAALPQTYGDITIEACVYGPGIGLPESTETSIMKGMVDICFKPENNANHDPEIISTPVTSAYAGQPYYYDVDAVDSDGDVLTYILTQSPPGMSINAMSGVISWIPSATQAGEIFNICVVASDGNGGTDSQSFDVTVPLTVQTPWATNSRSIPITEFHRDVTVGYNFTPQRNGIITRLGGHFNGTKTVYLWNAGTGELLRTVDVTSADSWSFSDISPVAVNPGTTYTVAASFSNISGDVVLSFINDNLPQTYGDITIEAAVYGSGNARPTAVGHFLYGIVDICFE